MFKFFGRGKKEEQSPLKLRDELIKLYSSKQTEHFIALCKENRQTIKEHYHLWQKIPDEIRASSPEKLDEYAQPLIALAHIFRQMGDTTLIELIQRDAASNPIERWQTGIISSRKLMSEGKLNEAKGILLPMTSEIEASQGNAKQEFLPKVYGQLGVISYHLKDAEGAITNTHKALVLCREYKDMEGIVAYTGTLLELMSQMGLAEEGNQLAKERVAALKLLGRMDEAAKHEQAFEA